MDDPEKRSPATTMLPEITDSDSITEKVERPEDQHDAVPDTESRDQELSVNGTLETAIPEVFQHEYLHGMKLFIINFAFTLGGFLMLLDTSVVSTAIPRITSDFHSLDDVGWYGTSYLLASCSLQPLTGKIYSQFSSKWSAIAFFVLFELGSAVCGAATSSKMLIIGRAIAGLGTSGMMNGAYTILHACIVPEKYSFYLGFLMGASQLGLLAGPLLGGVLTEYTSWRWCFYINLPCGALIIFALTFMSIPEECLKTDSFLTSLKKLDLLGFTLFAPSAIQLILALEWGGIRYRWGSATIIGLFIGSFFNFLLFLAWEWHFGDDAMLPFVVIGKRVTLVSCFYIATFFGSLLCTTYFLPIYFQAVRDASPAQSGVNLLPSILTTMLFSVVCGGLIQRVGYYLPLGVIGGALNSLGTGLSSTFTPNTRVGIWIGYQILQGVGRGFSFLVPITAIQNNSEKKYIPVANALITFAQNLGGTIVLSLAQVIFSGRLRHGLAVYAPDVNAQMVINAGATAVRDVTTPSTLPGVKEAYTKAFDAVMYLGAGIAALQFLLAFGTGWVNVRKKATVKPDSGTETA